MFRLIFLLLALCAVSGADLLFEDYFDGGSPVGWTEYSTNPDSANFYVDTGWFHMAINGVNSGVYALNGDDETTSIHVMSVPDYTFYCKSKAWSPTGFVAFGARFIEPFGVNAGYGLWFRYSEQDLVLFRHDGVGSSTVLAMEPFTLVYGVEYWIRFTVTGGHLQGKAWQGSLEDEPADYLLSVLDYTYGDPGSMGMGCLTYGPINNHVAFDSVMVYDPLSALESETWGAIKAAF